MKKGYLLAPGLGPIPPGVWRDMSAPIVHHCAPAVEPPREEVREGVIFAAPGTRVRGILEA